MPKIFANICKHLQTPLKIFLVFANILLLMSDLPTLIMLGVNIILGMYVKIMRMIGVKSV